MCQIFSRSVQGLRSSDTPKLPFPIDLLRRPYNSVALPCDTVISCITHVNHTETLQSRVKVSLTGRPSVPAVPTQSELLETAQRAHTLSVHMTRSSHPNHHHSADDLPATHSLSAPQCCMLNQPWITVTHTHTHTPYKTNTARTSKLPIFTLEFQARIIPFKFWHNM